MPTWCHMFNSTLIGATRVWFDELRPVSIDSYKDLKAAFLAYFMQQKKYIKDHVQIHNIKQKDEETIADFMEWFKVETRRMKGAPKCMRISGFMHGVNNMELTKRLNEHVPKTMEEMKRGSTSEVSLGNEEGLAGLPPYKDTKRNSRDRGRKVPAATTYGDPRAADHSTRAWMNFMVVRSLSPYNGIIGRPGIKEIQAVPSTAHGMLKFLADEGIVTICSTILIPAECATVITSSKKKPKEAGLNIDLISGRDIHPFGKRKGVRPRNAPMPSKQRIVTPFQKSTGKLNLSAVPFQVFFGHLQRLSPDIVGRRLVDKAFDGKIGQNIEMYVDDLVIKSHTEAEMLRDIGETFCTLRKINMKLNPKKYMFGEVKGMFLGYMITLKEIKPCPDKTKAVLQLPNSRTIKEKCIKKSDFHWTLKVEQAFKQLKQHLSKLPLMVAPKPKEELIVYMFASYRAISAVLMTEKWMVRTPVYFVSRALQGPELNYTPIEKLVLSLVFAAKRLRRYFQAHPIAVITDQPIKQIMSRPDIAGRLQKWSIMLEEHNITYRPRTSVKGQVLVDFLAEMLDESPSDASILETQQEPWTLFTDGSSCMDGSGAGLILTSPEGTEFTYALRFQFAASNNEAEYEALIAGLQIVAHMGVKNVHVSVDSKLVASQVLGAYVAKEENMIKYLEKVLVEILKEKSIQEKEVTTVVEEDGPTWMTPIIEYLKEGTLPNDMKEARKLRIQYELLEEVLYKRSFLTSWLSKMKKG
nr:reverse transcriptase domain-containing protein [Tanacetum cinerariifolium]